MKFEKVILHNTTYLSDINKQTVSRLNLPKFNFKENSNHKKQVIVLLKNLDNELLAWGSILYFEKGIIYKSLMDIIEFDNINTLLENVNIILPGGEKIFEYIGEYTESCLYYNKLYSYTKHLINHNWCPIDQLYFITNSFFIYPYPKNIPKDTKNFSNDTFKYLQELYPKKITYY
jgi:hypothetical protein